MRRPMYFSREELEWLLTRLGDDPFKFRRQFMFLLQEFNDAAEKLRETTARTMASAHYEEEDAPKLKPPKSSKLEERIRAAVDTLTEDEICVLLKRHSPGS